jgi:hypothetical protein
MLPLMTRSRSSSIGSDEAGATSGKPSGERAAGARPSL